MIHKYFALILRAALCLACYLFLIGCEKQQKNLNDSFSEIHWLQGDIESAFDKAKQENKFVLLYWGAVWCPPCNQLKATVFKDPDFIAKTRLFIPVYLDGDTEGAQVYGEKFNVAGYPTLIVLDSNANEITRIPGGMDLKRYEEVLDLVLNFKRPVVDIVRDFESGISLSQNDFKLLSLYSWEQDKGKILENDAASRMFELFKACPDALAIAKSRLFSAWWFARRSGLEEKALDTNEKQVATSEAVKILNDPELIRNNLRFVLYDRGQFFSLLEGDEQSEFLDNWNQALAIIEEDKSLPKLVQLSPSYTRLYLLNLNKAEEDFEFTPEQKQKIITLVDEARADLNDKYEHSAVMNLFWYLLTTAGLNEKANEVFDEEIKNAASPYYFMVDLAESARLLGREQEALDWLQRAYKESKLGATHFQWGVIYFQGLLEMFPEREDEIVSLFSELLAYVKTREDALYNRNQNRFKRLIISLKEWNTEGRYAASYKAMSDGFNVFCSERKNIKNDGEKCESLMLEWAQ